MKMENILYFWDESIYEHLRSRPKPHYMNMGAFKSENKIITQNCDVDKKKRPIKKRRQIIDRRFFIYLVNPVVLNKIP